MIEATRPLDHGQHLTSIRNLVRVGIGLQDAGPYLSVKNEWAAGWERIGGEAGLERPDEADVGEFSLVAQCGHARDAEKCLTSNSSLPRKFPHWPRGALDVAQMALGVSQFAEGLTGRRWEWERRVPNQR